MGIFPYGYTNKALKQPGQPRKQSKNPVPNQRKTTPLSPISENPELNRFSSSISYPLGSDHSHRRIPLAGSRYRSRMDKLRELENAVKCPQINRWNQSGGVCYR